MRLEKLLNTALRLGVQLGRSCGRSSGSWLPGDSSPQIGAISSIGAVEVMKVTEKVNNLEGGMISPPLQCQTLVGKLVTLLSRFL